MKVYDGLGSRFEATIIETIPGREACATIKQLNGADVFVALKNVQGRWFMAYDDEVSYATRLAVTTAAMSETFVCCNVECKTRPGVVTCVPTVFPGDGRRFCSEECMAEEIR